MIDDHTAAQIIVRHVLGDRYANTDWVHERAAEAWRELRATSDLKHCTEEQLRKRLMLAQQWLKSGNAPMGVR